MFRDLTGPEGLRDILAARLASGHGRPTSGLLNDASFAAGRPVAAAAVLIAVTERPRPGVILTRRPETMRHHPGQVAFPGGKLEPGEDPVAAALREAEEELGIAAAAVRLVGETDRYQTGTGFDITPVVATVPPDLPLRPDPREVESWFEAPLDLLLDRAGWARHAVEWRGARREYLEREVSGYRIWGVTAAIIANLALRLELGASALTEAGRG